MTLIGLNGQLASGKDTVYLRAKEIGLRPVERLAFADKLKNSACALLGITREQMEELKRDDDLTLQWGSPALGMVDIGAIPEISMRLFLQRYGTEAHRDIFGDNFWVDQCVPIDLDHEGKVVFVTDVRFPNEAKRIREAGGLVVRVLNGPLIQDGHASEQILDDSLIDHEIDNSVRNDNYNSLDDQVVLLLNGALETYA